jgi:hypothetical protein
MQKLAEMICLVNPKCKCTQQIGVLAGALGDTRMTMRLFESLRTGAGLAKLMAGESSILKPARIVNSISWILYWICENVGILAKLKVLNANAPFFFKASYVCLLLHFVSKMYELYIGYCKASSESDEAAVSNLKWTMLSECIDAFGLLPYLGIMKRLASHKSFVGFYVVWDFYCASMNLLGAYKNKK